MSKFFIGVVLAVFLTACGSDYVGADWQDAPVTHRCSNDEMERVHREAEWCSKNTAYHGAYCYGIAIIRVCDRIEREAKEQIDN